MIGYPKTLATKADVTNLLAVDAYKTRVLADLQTLLDERYVWLLKGKLADEDAGDTSTGHKVVTVTAKNVAGEDVTERYQYAWGLQDANALTRMGITVAEAVAWGCEDKVIEAPTNG